MAAGRRAILWAPKARQDLVDIWIYSAKVASPEVADSLLRDIQGTVNRLGDHPYMGRPRGEIANGLRSALVHPHSVFYRVTETNVEVARVLHERRDFAAAFSEGSKP
jgi:toxin ParE1/3/4